MTPLGDHPPGTVAIPAGEFTRFGGFVHSLACTPIPPGTRVMMQQSVSIASNLNEIIRHTLEAEEPRLEWVWCQSDDHIWFPDLLWRLLDREVQVVVPLVAQRKPPFNVVLYERQDEEGYWPYRWEALPQSGLLEVWAAGSAGMLIRREALEAVGDPWFEFDAGFRCNEDLVFCRKLREAGIPIHADVEQRMGHRGTFTAWPVHQDGHRGVSVELGTSATGQPHNLIFIDPLQQQ